jgi:SRSO17 transposase
VKTTQRYPAAEVERMMKLQDVLLKAIAKKMTWWEAAEIIGVTDRTMRRRRAGVPKEIEFQTKPEIAMDQIARALDSGLPCGVVLADAGYGSDTRFRERLAEMGLQYVVGVQGGVSVWRPGEAPLPPKARGRRGRPPKLLRRSKHHRPVSARELVIGMGQGALRRVAWREGSNRKLQSRFVAVRVRPAHRDYWRAEPHEELWLVAEWPRGSAEPTKYWLANLPAETTLEELVRLAKHRWIVERDYLELKQELGLGHFEGRSWRGFHHHATLCIAAYGFLVAERSLFSPSARAGRLTLAGEEPQADYRPRGSPGAGPEA